MKKDKTITSHNDSVDDRLLSNFFADSRSMHIADDGFADSVMQRIAETATCQTPIVEHAASHPQPEIVPRRQRLYYSLGSAACAVACVVVFVFSDGLGLLKSCLHSALVSAVSSAALHMPSVPHLYLPAMDMGNVGMATPFAVTLALVVVGSLALYDLKES